MPLIASIFTCDIILKGVERRFFNLNLYTEYKNVYFLGIGGISMSALALILKRNGCKVSGYDGARNSEVETLEKAGIPVVSSVDAIDLDGYDLIVFTAAITDSHPAMIKAKSSGVKIISRAALLGAIASKYRHSAGIAGTHGKSTCSGMLARICEEAGDSTYIVGAVLPFLDSTYKLGSDDKIVFEACEYCDSFLEFHPSIGVALNVKLDHTDYFADENAFVGSFTKYLSGCGLALINGDDENAVKAAKNSGVKTYTFSVNKSGDFLAVYNGSKKGFPEFDVFENSVLTTHIKLSVPGLHNVYNAIAAYACARLMGISAQNAVSGLEKFCGVKRRFELCENINSKARFYADYAHHPDELNSTIKAARSVTNGRIIAVFQPHTYSRLKYFFDGFVSSLSNADEVIITDVYAAREAPDPSVSGKLLADAINGARYIPDFKVLADVLLKEAKEGDLVLILGAGDIIGLVKVLQEKR